MSDDEKQKKEESLLIAKPNGTSVHSGGNNTAGGRVIDSRKLKRVSNRLEEKVVGIGAPETWRTKFYKHTKTRRGLVLIVLSLLFVVGMGLFLTTRKPTKPTMVKSPTVCRPGSSIYGDVVSAIYLSKYEEAKKVSDKIMSDNNYQKDANCLAGLVAYYQFIGDLDNAKQRFSELSKIAKDDYVLDMQYNAIGINKVHDFKEQLEEKEKEAERLRANILFTN